MKSYTKESKPFVPDCKDYFSRYCVEDCNWFGVCWDFQKEVEDDFFRKTESDVVYGNGSGHGQRT